MLPRFGIEFEIAEFEHSYKRFIRSLYPRIDAGFESGPHRYYCDCVHCRYNTRQVELKFPVVWHAKQDVTVGRYGAEMISSVMIPNEVFLSSFSDALEIFQEHVVYSQEGADRYGRQISPGLHVHTSIKLRDNTDNRYFDDLARMLAYITPAIYVLAAATGKRRIFFHRQVPVYTHKYVAIRIREARNASESHLEWRAWEADPDSRYVLAASLVSCALQEMFSDGDILKDLLEVYMIAEKELDISRILLDDYDFGSINASLFDGELDFLLKAIRQTHTYASCGSARDNVEWLFDLAGENVKGGVVV